ncbi:hypothetical protein CDD83_7738 [Cordyceps sp. RAO-2017]|nr:hypothetical protein CDD83_7738 [Cordyceps sp. RAO-2017]
MAGPSSLQASRPGRPQLVIKNWATMLSFIRAGHVNRDGQFLFRIECSGCNSELYAHDDRSPSPKEAFVGPCGHVACVRCIQREPGRPVCPACRTRLYCELCLAQCLILRIRQPHDYELPPRDYGDNFMRTVPQGGTYDERECHRCQQRAVWRALVQQNNLAVSPTPAVNECAKLVLDELTRVEAAIANFAPSADQLWHALMERLPQLHPRLNLLWRHGVEPETAFEGSILNYMRCRSPLFDHEPQTSLTADLELDIRQNLADAIYLVMAQREQFVDRELRRKIRRYPHDWKFPFQEDTW